MNDEYFMSLALEEAKIALEENEVPVGAILVMDNKIIAKGHNTKEKDKLITSHAEINVINKACKLLNTYHLEKSVLYVTLEPCQMCIGAIQQAKIQRIVYGARDNKNGALGGLYDFLLIPKLNHYPFITFLVLEEECKSILKDYFKSLRK